MKFNELSKNAQREAVKKYQIGWYETHPNDPLCREEVYEILNELDDDFNSKGDLK